MVRKLCYHLYLLVADLRLVGGDFLRSKLIDQLLSIKTERLVIMSGCFFEGLENLTLGNGVSFNQDCFISAIGGIKIGDHVSIGHRTTILSTEHSFDDAEVYIRDQPLRHLQTVIEDDVWIGANVTLLAGAKIGSRSIVAAGAVVRRGVYPDGSIIGGIPATVLKNIPSQCNDV